MRSRETSTSKMPPERDEALAKVADAFAKVFVAHGGVYFSCAARNWRRPTFSSELLNFLRSSGERAL